MALKVTDDGFVIIKNQKQATEALGLFRSLKAELDELKAEHGIDDLEKDLIGYKVAVENYMIENDLERIDGDEWHGTLIKGFYDSHWVTTADDLTDDDPEGTKTLQQIIEEKFKSSISTKGSKARKVWMKITKRVADHEGIEALVAEGKLKVDELSPAWVEKIKKPYLRLFED